MNGVTSPASCGFESVGASVKYGRQLPSGPLASVAATSVRASTETMRPRVRLIAIVSFISPAPNWRGALVLLRLAGSAARLRGLLWASCRRRIAVAHGLNNERRSAEQVYILLRKGMTISC